jgi:hypothetical protein
MGNDIKPTDWGIRKVAKIGRNAAEVNGFPRSSHEEVSVRCR